MKREMPVARRRGFIKKVEPVAPPVAEKQPTSKDTLLILSQIVAERVRQDGKFGGPKADDKQTPDYWLNELEAHIVWAHRAYRIGRPSKYRALLLRIGALAVAASESFDRDADFTRNIPETQNAKTDNP